MKNGMVQTLRGTGEGVQAATVSGALVSAIRDLGLDVQQAASAAATGALRGAGEVSREALDQARSTATGMIPGIKVVAKEPFKS